MTYQEAYLRGTKLLEQAGISDAKIDAKELLLFASGMNLSAYLMKMRDEIPLEEWERYESYLQKRQGHIPLQQIVGVAYFMGYPFFVSEDVLIPRQDTETLVELTEKALREIEHKSNLELLDICTGSGCIGISLRLRAEDRGDDIKVTLSDLSEKALRIAKENSANLNTRVNLIQSDLFQKIDKNFDVIVSNPPYIKSQVIEGLDEEVRLHDPYLALDGGEDGLMIYRRLIPEAYEHLKEEGMLLLEIGYDQGEEVAELMRASHFEEIEIEQDLTGKDRVVLGRKR